MFRMVKQPRAWAPVTWMGLSEDGEQVQQGIELRFLLLKVDQTAAFLADVVAAQAKESESGVDLPRLYAGLVSRIADDWRGVAAENGEALPWSSENLLALMNEGGMFHRIFHAWRAALAGAPETRAGN